MKFINISKGMKAIVDDDNYKYLKQFSWYYSKSGYAFRRLKTFYKDKQKHLSMHREIMAEDIRKSKNKKLVVDHINKNKLDNRKENLRLVTQSINALNCKVRKNNTSGYVGVNKTKNNGRIRKDGTRAFWMYWRAYVVVNNKQKHIGLFKSKEEAIKKRKEYMRDNNYLC